MTGCSTPTASMITWRRCRRHERCRHRDAYTFGKTRSARKRSTKLLHFRSAHRPLDAQPVDVVAATQFLVRSLLPLLGVAAPMTLPLRVAPGVRSNAAVPALNNRVGGAAFCARVGDTVRQDWQDW